MGYVSSVSSDVTAYEPITTSGSVTISGLGNGTDFSEIIDATIETESFLLDEYEENQEETEYLIDLLELLDDEIEDLQEFVEDMDEPDEFFEMDGTCNGDEVDITLTGEAEEGVHTIIVNQLAQKDVWVNSEYGFSSEDATVADEDTTLEFTYDGETISIDVSDGTTLEGLVNAVNNSTAARDKVEASLIYDGDEYFFVLSGVDEGADYAITIDDTGSLSNFDISNFTNTQTAQNAQIKVDGFPVDDDEWIERSTNEIDDVVDGITFELVDVTDEDGVRITVEYDTDAMMEKIVEFTEMMNQIILDIQTLTGRIEDEDADEDEETYTVDSYAMDIIYNNLKYTLSSGAVGFLAYDEEDGGDYYNALSQIGFSTDADEGSDTFGQLILDEDELEEALDTDPEAVGDLFSASGDGVSDSDSLEFISLIDSVTEAGEYEVEYTVESGVLVSATINGETATVNADSWTILASSGDAKGLYLSVLDQDDGTYSGTVRVKEGILGSLSDVLDGISNEETGTLTILIDNYEESLTQIENDIYNEEKRLDALEDSLTRKYAALESVLSELESTGDLLDTLLADLE